MNSLWLLTKTDRYRPQKLLGRGGMGAVYEVEDTATGGRVALKLMLDQDPRRLLRFKQEFRMVAELHHPNLVRLFDLGFEDNRWYFTMELIEGQSLLDVLLLDAVDDDDLDPSTVDSDEVARLVSDSQHGDTPLTAPQTPIKPQPACDLDGLTAVLAQVLDALEYLHARGIVHRDLKPGNILVDVHGVVRLLDFGLASQLDRNDAISREGSMIGTLAYMSPEQCLGAVAGPASDLYALGCVMFQLLTGALPFGTNPAYTVQARLTGPPPRVDERVKGVPAPLVELCAHLLARDPDQRPSIAQVREALAVKRARDPASSAEMATDHLASFVGRTRELALLHDCVERAARGQLQLALISGPSGIGKSTLAAMVSRHARRRGFSVFSGRCYQREQVPYVAFDRAVDAMTLTLARWRSARLDPIREALIALRHIFPALTMLTGNRPDQAGEDDPRLRVQRAFDGFCQVVEHLQASAPVLFVLDDLQWASEDSVALLEALISRAAGRVFVLGLLRPEGVGPGHPMSRIVDRAARSQPFVSLTLDPLAPAEVVELVEVVAGRRFDPALSAALARQAAGNPFLTLQLADHLARTPELATMDSDERAAHIDDRISVDDLVRARIDALSPNAEVVLSLAATAGGDVANHILRDASGLTAEQYAMAIGELMALRMCKAQPTSPVDERSPDEPRGAETSDTPRLRVDLYHDRIRETAYERLADDRRRDLHCALATALEAQPHGRARDVEDLLHHWTEAGDHSKRRRYAIEAAERAVAALAFRRAEALFRRVVADPAPDDDAIAIARYWDRIGELCEYTGRFDAASDANQRALDLWTEAPGDREDRQVMLLRLHGRVSESLVCAGRLSEGRAAYERGLALLDLPPRRSRAGLLATLARLRSKIALTSLLPARLTHRKATPLRQEQIAFFQRMVRALLPVWPMAAAEGALRCELLGWQLDDKQIVQRAIASRASVPFMLGRSSRKRFDQARNSLDEAEALAREHDIPLGVEFVQLHRGLAWFARDIRRAKRLIQDAHDGYVRHGMGDFHDGAFTRTLLTLTLAASGDLDDALALIQRDLDRSNHFINIAYALSQKTWIHAARGQCDDAERAVERLSAHLDGVPVTGLTAPWLLARSVAWFAQGNFSAVVDLAEQHERDSQNVIRHIPGFVFSIWIEAVLDAYLGLARRGQLSPDQRAQARRYARQLARQDLMDYPCVGYRALALLDHEQGRERAARRALNRALDRSTHNASCHRRWRCLDAARELGAMTAEFAAEADELTARCGFVMPAAWDE